MGAKSKIQWCDATWNVVTGCTHVSEGCRYCYAERVVPRQQQKFSDIVLHPERMDIPLHWRKPRKVFVNSLSDLFHEQIPDSFLDQVFLTMAKGGPAFQRWSDYQHTFQVLTKRPERMLEYLSNAPKRKPEWQDVGTYLLESYLRNVWIGVSVEDQKTADERIPILLQTPAALRFVSVEPLLEPVVLSAIKRTQAEGYIRPLDGRFNKLGWVIIGGESGHKARPLQLKWVRDLIQECKVASVHCFVKQLGANPQTTDPLDLEWRSTLPLKDRKGGDWDEWPEDLRVRESPKKCSPWD